MKLYLTLFTTLGLAAAGHAFERAEDNRPLATSPFNEKAILAALSTTAGKVASYKLRLNKGWLDKNRLSVTIIAEVLNSRGERESISRNAVITFQDGRQASIVLE